MYCTHFYLQYDLQLLQLHYLPRKKKKKKSRLFNLHVSENYEVFKLISTSKDMLPKPETNTDVGKQRPHLKHTVVAILLFGKDFECLLIITRSNDTV